MNWQELQNNHHVVLRGSLLDSLNCPNLRHVKEASTQAGNYLIYNQKQLLYVGQGLNIQKRLSSHFKNSKYTVYGNNLLFKEFPNQLGRKEFEEYVMFYLKTANNTSHKKRIFKVFEESEETALSMWKQSHSIKQKLLSEGLIEAVEKVNNNWEDTEQPGVYLVRRNNELIYVGETLSLNQRISSHHMRTRMSVLRRTIAKDIMGFNLKTQAELGNLKSRDKKKSFLTSKEDLLVNQFISECNFSIYRVLIGRIELEEMLIQRLSPMLNRKGNTA